MGSPNRSHKAPGGVGSPSSSHRPLEEGWGGRRKGQTRGRVSAVRVPECNTLRPPEDGIGRFGPEDPGWRHRPTLIPMDLDTCPSSSEANSLMLIIRAVIRGALTVGQALGWAQGTTGNQNQT